MNSVNAGRRSIYTMNGQRTISWPILSMRLSRTLPSSKRRMRLAGDSLLWEMSTEQCTSGMPSECTSGS